jgi:Holliday junction DNA helicase RuvB
MHSRIVTLHLKPFTLIGATTRTGMISGPMRSRFGIPHHLRFYDEDDLLAIGKRSARLLEIEIGDEMALRAIARRSRGTPRILNRLLRRVRDYALVHGKVQVDRDVVEKTLELEGIDAIGMDELDRMYLQTIAQTYRGGPVGLEAIAATLNEDAGTLEDTVEPFLLQTGYLARTRRGRQLTPRGAEHIGATGLTLEAIDDAASDNALFPES